MDTTRSHLNFHLVRPQGKYRAEAEKQIAAAGCRTRTDSVRMIETLITASPEFFEGKSRKEIRAFFQCALDFIEAHQNPETILSAVVHMDEKTPHMHLAFVPLTPDGRLSAKEIIGNKKKLTWWQDEFWEHMVKNYPELERGQSAGETGRDHIPPRVYKEMTRLTKQKEKLDQLLDGINPLNAKSRAGEINKILTSYIPNVEKMDTQLKKYRKTFRKTVSENQELKAENQKLSGALDAAQDNSVLKKMKELQLQHEYQEALDTLARIPPEVLEMYTGGTAMGKERAIDEVL